MRLFLDTSVIVAGRLHMGVGNLSTLEEFARRPDVEIVTSRVVIEEVVNKYRERLTEECQKARSILKSLSETSGMSLGLPITVQTIEELVEKYRQELIYLFEDSGGWIMPIPKISHELLVERAISRVKPFGGKNDGYRDALIWHSALEALHEAKGDGLEMIYFGTGNSGDFAQHKDTPDILHGDLVRDIEDRGYSEDDMALFVSLGDIIGNHVEYKMKEMAAIQGRILKRMWRQGEFDQDVIEALAVFIERRPETVLADDDDWDDVEVDQVTILEYRDARVSSTEYAYYRVEVDVEAECSVIWTPWSPPDDKPSRLASSQSQSSETVTESRITATVSFLVDGDWPEYSTAVWQEDPGDLELV